MVNPDKRTNSVTNRFGIFYSQFCSKAVFDSQTSPAVPAGGLAAKIKRSTNLATHEPGFG
jgi:hypothetical protein